MGARTAKVSHRLRTALGFAAFGLGAVCMAGVLLPLQRLMDRRGPHDLRAQASIHRAARRYLRFAGWLGFVRLAAPVAEGLAGRGPRLVVANHPSLLDAVVLFSLLPQADCVVKASWARNPFLRGVARAAGYISNASGPAAVADCVARLEAGRTLLVFPEGTRSPVGALGPFQRGAAHASLRSGVPLTPVVIRCEPAALAKGQSWYDVPEGGFQVTVRVLDPISPEGARYDGVAVPVAARRLTAELRETVAKTLADH
jgi:1-acyl-sn-glycerol-3-phosphate acyltransferase